MKKFFSFFFTASALTLSSFTVSAQGTSVSVGGGELEMLPVRKAYISQGLDGALFQTAAFEKPGRNRELTTLRFSYILNLGFNWNYDFDEHFGVFTGLGIKNLGFIEKEGDSTIKRRVYTLGMPFGFKIGNLQKRNFYFSGIGFDVPFNYREKGFVNRRDKHKMSDWFSNRTETFMPYVFAGLSVNPGMTFKLQYYPSNFFNVDYVDDNAGAGENYKPYAGYDARLITFSVGFDIQYKKKAKVDNAEDAEVPADEEDSESESEE